ncbi:MAG: galactokinase, partial [Caulobacteraceae bacterium]
MNAALLERVLGAFADAFGGAPDLVAQAPGRVNLIGEHTDYNDGFVLPCAIDRGTLVAARSRGDAKVTIVADDYAGERDGFSLARPIEPRPDGGWTNYVRGMVKSMAAASKAASGVDLVIAGDVPPGAGLSSSASLMVAIGEALRAIWRVDDVGPRHLARMAQRTEGEFAGCHCGIMDPLISAAAVVDHALLIDCRSLDTRPVPIPEDLAILIVHSGVSRELAGGAYNERRASCEAAARHFGVAALRDLDLAALGAGRAGLDPVAFRRARHVVTENSRTLAAAEALARGDLPTVGRLMAASHASMRGDF